MTTAQPAGFNVNYHLARFHRVSRRYGPAIRLHQEALAERERTLGPDHPETLRSCTGLANSFYAAGHYGMAMDLFRETLQRRSRTLGPEHPDTLRSRGSLGNCYHATGDYKTAIQMHRQTLAVRQRVLGRRPSQHPGQPQQPGKGRTGPGRKSLRQSHHVSANRFQRRQ